jgi:5'-nucleotidase
MENKEKVDVAGSPNSPQNRITARPEPRRRPIFWEYLLLLLLVLLMLAGPYVLSSTTRRDDKRVVRLTLLQLNDVYQILPSDIDGSGGLARIATLQKQILSESDNILFLFAGDTISPSLESIEFKGQQMIDLWNNLGLNVAVLGNHEFDFKPDVLRQRIKESHFTWLAANVIDKRTGAPFGGAQSYLIKEVDGVKVGIFGLLTKDTMKNSQPGPDIEFLDPIATARSLVPQMRAQGATVIIALTHLAMEEDKRLAQAVRLDLILGGHDHELMQSQAAGTPIYKMGSDARNFGRIEVKIAAETGEVQNIEARIIPVTKDVPEESRTRAIIDDYERRLEEKLGVKLDDTIGESTVALDAEQESVRGRESNVGDLIADTFREVTKADVALINGGGIRSDRLYPAGPITNRHFYSILPFKNKVVLIQVKGSELRKALERGVSSVVENREDGGFPQVSGLQFVYNGLRPPGSRLVSVTVQGQPLDDNRTYSLATISYLASGNEGYEMLGNKPDMIPPTDSKYDVDIMLEKIKSGPVSPQIDGRITRRDQP